MDDLVIRPETSADLAAIAEVVAAAFGSEAEARLVEAIRASDRFIPELALVADLDGEVVGHVMISYVDLEGSDGAVQPIASLSPLAVAPAVQGQGVGSALVRAVTAEADRRGEPAVVLEGNPLYYGRFGFEFSTPRGITLPLPSWASPQAGQILCLERYDPSRTGKVVYPPAFDGVTEH